MCTQSAISPIVLHLCACCQSAIHSPHEMLPLCACRDAAAMQMSSHWHKVWESSLLASSLLDVLVGVPSFSRCSCELSPGNPEHAKLLLLRMSIRDSHACNIARVHWPGGYVLRPLNNVSACYWESASAMYDASWLHLQNWL